MKAHLGNVLVVGSVFTVLSAASSASTLFVNRALSTGNNDGSSWTNAFRDPDAVAVALAAALPGDEIWVAAGTYFATTTTTRTLSHQLESGVGVYGGFAGNETLLSQRDFALHVTTLSGDIGVTGVNTDNSYHVVEAAGTDATAILDGFTIQFGRSEFSTPIADRDGGGLRCIGGAGPTIRNCRFANNFSGGAGGGAYLELSAPSFTDCRFEGNSATAGGGCFSRTTSATFERCEFSGHSALTGGAMWLVEQATPPAGPPRLTNCLLRSNSATDFGGILSGGDIEIRNCTIAFNTYIGTSATAAVDVGPGSTIVNCIVYYNGPFGPPHTSEQQIAGTSAVTYSIVEGGFVGPGNSGSNPLFASGQARVRIGSPAIDAGDNGAVPPGTMLDLAREPRFVDEPLTPDTGLGTAPIVDIGAFEGPAPYSRPRAFCFGNGSGVACPCGNNAPPSSGNGCGNSTGGAGRLDAEGIATIVFDNLVLRGSQMPDGACLYLQGTAPAGGGDGVLFGDGLLCVSGAFVRLWTLTNVAGVSQVPPLGGPSVRIRGQVGVNGGVRHYQVWYRDAATFCTADTWNMTNAIWVNWEY